MDLGPQLPMTGALTQGLVDSALNWLAPLIMKRVQEAKAETFKPEYVKRQKDPTNPFYKYIRARIQEDLPRELGAVVWPDGESAP